ncbi:MAG: DEAD/DEAH box helicase [Bradymonadaceae bacterium]|nr:DEAD/DEAH box helicase [Lujinxingiaceae bacterium]
MSGGSEEQQYETFESLGLSAPILQALIDAGYESPTPIQQKTIPSLLGGRDLVGRAQTGTGKTAAFSIPLLEALDPDNKAVQAIVLTPTRELAIQVAESLETYSRHLKRISVLPVYGGQHIGVQLTRLRRDVHIVVGTPGRVMDHLRRGTLKLDHVKMLVLDEADEMLRMGFIDDVEWILDKTPAERQTALFSATMPPEIMRIAKRHLKDPVNVEISQTTVAAIEQRFIRLAPRQKFDTLRRILESEPRDGVLVFARTRADAAELTTQLGNHGFAAESLHGDMSQQQREHVTGRFKEGRVDIVVGTDVAARGLDVDHITHVINYEIPNDTDTYVHRIGRTGRAGRSGVAILFVTAREMRMVNQIERATRQTIKPMQIPTNADIETRRIEHIKERIRKALADEKMEFQYRVVKELAAEGIHMTEIAAAAAFLAEGGKKKAFDAEPAFVPEFRESRGERPDRGDRPDRKDRPSSSKRRRDSSEIEAGMVRLFVAGGAKDGFRPSDLVGAIASEAKIPGHAIGSITIGERATLVELPAEFEAKVIDSMKDAQIRGRNVEVRKATASDDVTPSAAGRPVRPGKPAGAARKPGPKFKKK